MPGAGGAAFPLKSYYKDVEMDRFDAFVMFTKGRFGKIDSDVSNLIVKTGKPCFFGRTHIDVNMTEELNDLEEIEREDKAKAFATKIRQNCIEALKVQKSKMQLEEEDIFLLTKYPNKFEAVPWIP